MTRITLSSKDEEHDSHNFMFIIYPSFEKSLEERESRIFREYFLKFTFCQPDFRE